MSIKTILAPIMTAESASNLIDAATLLAGRFGAHVDALHIRRQYAYYPLVAYYPMAMDIPAMVNEQQEEAATKAAEALHDLVEAAVSSGGAHFVKSGDTPPPNGVSVAWHDARGVIPIDFGRAARIADLSIVCQPDKEASGLETPIFESLLMSSSRPVFVIQRERLTSVPSRILLAWDGSEQAARAMHAAMPFLEMADAVEVVTIGDEDLGTPTPEEVVTYLSRRGIRAEAVRIEWPKHPVAERLISQAEAKACDLIVMGGYSHARMYETFLGGATKDMLQHADRPVLMAH